MNVNGKLAPVASFTVFYFVLTTVPAHAYLDPGTGSIVLQSIIGGVAAGLFIAKGYWYRIKGFFARKGAEAGNNPSE